MTFNQPPRFPDGNRAAGSRFGSRRHGNQRSRAIVRLVPLSHRQRPTDSHTGSPKGDSHVECELAAQNA